MSDRYEVTSSRNGIYKVKVQLPEKLTCKHCIIQVTCNNDLSRKIMITSFFTVDPGQWQQLGDVP